MYELASVVLMQRRGALQAQHTSADGDGENVYERSAQTPRRRSSGDHADHNSSRHSNGTTTVDVYSLLASAS